jgi:hypothetical protein
MSLIPSRVWTEMNTKFYAPIGLKELEDAMEAMANKKALGPDGVTVEFFKTNWNLVGPDYLRMVKLGL